MRIKRGAGTPTIKRLRPHLIASIIFCVCFCLLPLPATAQEEWYSVQSSDTIASIAAQFGISAQAIVERNGLAPASQIIPGQILLIPLSEQTAAEQEGCPNTEVENAGRTHIVQPGESLQAIGQLYGIEWRTLAIVNNISNPYLIYAGQALVLPAAGQVESAPAFIAAPRQVQPSSSRRQHRIYIVQYGDYFNRIAQRFGVATDEILRLNGFRSGTGLFIGDVLLIPAASSPTSPATTTIVDGGDIQHIVQPGETLATIAARYGRTVADIAVANNLLNPNRIYVGQALIIP